MNMDTTVLDGLSCAFVVIHLIEGKQILQYLNVSFSGKFRKSVLKTIHSQLLAIGKSEKVLLSMRSLQ
jgi:hypothetical protein